MSQASNLEQFMKMYPVWKDDWVKFASDVGGVRLDREQSEILYAIQTGRRISVRSGTARGKDFVAAIASVCFLYLTVFDEDWNFYATKVVNTAPTGRQIKNIMIPEISKFFSKGYGRGLLPGRMLADGIRFSEDVLRDWYLVGFKAGDDAVEAWSGIHAPNVMVVITEASGIDQVTFDSIEGILQGNSRLLLIFNPNRMTGEAYKSQTSPQYKKFVLNCMNAPNVLNERKLRNGEITEKEFKRLWIPGQVDYTWLDEKVKKPGWATIISEDKVNPAEFDFEWEGRWYRPSDLFRVKVLGEFPKESEEQLIPIAWVEAAQQRWIQYVEQGWNLPAPLKLGVDIAGMGRDMTVFCKRFGVFVDKFEIYPKTTHMEDAGRIKHVLAEHRDSKGYIDTIGEGAGVYSRLEELGISSAVSTKFSEGAKGLNDMTGAYEFANMRAYLFWAIRDWLNPMFGSEACLPPDDELTEELTSIEYKFQSNGKILIEEKDEIKKKIGRSPDRADSLANTFYPYAKNSIDDSEGIFGMFH